MQWIEIQGWKLLCAIKKKLLVCFCNMVFLYHLSSQMLIKEQYAQEVDQMRNPKEKDMVNVFFFTFAVLLNKGMQRTRGH